jgi:large subunit ribosomal protein L25
MEKVVLNAEKRDVIGKQVKAMRRSGKLPAVIYGRHTEPISISLDAHSASLILGRLTSSSLVTIALDGQEYPALVRE